MLQGSNAELNFDTETLFKDIFGDEQAKQAAGEFEKAMQYLISEEPELGQQFHKLQETAQSAGIAAKTTHLRHVISLMHV